MRALHCVDEAHRYDLMHSINGRGTFAVSQACIPHLKKSAEAGRNPHILMVCPASFSLAAYREALSLCSAVE
jgi:hypothetical protein